MELILHKVDTDSLDITDCEFMKSYLLHFKETIEFKPFLLKEINHDIEMLNTKMSYNEEFIWVDEV